MMKILIIISNKGIGGAQRVAMQLARWINKESNSKASIISLTSIKGQHEYDMSDLNVYVLKPGNIIKQLVKIFKETNADIVLSMGIPMLIYTMPATLIAGKKHVVSERNDPAHFAGKKVIKIISRFLMRFADGFVFQTKDAVDYYGLNDNPKAKIIHNPLSGVENMPQLPYQGERKKVIVTAGRLVDQKNHKLLIDAFARLQDLLEGWKLKIYGDGAKKEELKNYIVKKRLSDKVFLMGISNNIYSEIYDASCFVLSSDFEGMPNALMEALALGLPCISTDCPCGGPRELITDGINGILVPVGDVDKLVQSMKLIAENEMMRDFLGSNAFNIRLTHNVDIISKEWYTYLSTIFLNK